MGRRRKHLPGYIAIIVMAALAAGSLYLADHVQELRAAAKSAGLPDIIGSGYSATTRLISDLTPEVLTNPERVLALNAPRAPRTFDEAKRILAPIFNAYPIDMYCGCTYDPRSREVDTQSCGIAVHVHQSRLRRIEFEHVVPISNAANFRPCWRNPPPGMDGRTHCTATDPEFNLMEGDPFNLLPVVGALNAIRSNHRYGEIPGERRDFGRCDFEFDPHLKIVEPPSWIKGDIARIQFYYADRYGLRLSDAQRRLFEAWSKQDPVDELELARVHAIARKVGWTNPYVTSAAPDPDATWYRP